jgi:hypothetical protein
MAAATSSASASLSRYPAAPAWSGLGEAGHRHHLRLGVALGDGRDCGDPVHSGHHEVHQHRIGRPPGRHEHRNLLQGLLPVGCLADHLHVVHRVQVGTQATPDDGVVVDDQHSEWPLLHVCSPWRIGRLGWMGYVICRGGLASLDR